MIECIKEKNVWDTLKADEKPIVLYGMGDGADKILDVFSSKGIKCTDIFASDEFVRGHFFHGMRVKKYSEIEQMYGEFTVVLSFASRRDEIIEKIYEIDKSHEVLAPDVPVAGIGLFSREFIEEHDEEFNAAYNLLADGESKQNFINILNFKVSGKIKYLLPFCDKSRVYSEFLRFSGESIADLGAYDGDTIREFIAADPDYKKIFAFEPDEKNYNRLLKKTAGLRDIVPFCMGAWNREELGRFSSTSNRNSALALSGKLTRLNSLDNVTDEKISVLKMDIEGSEMKAIEGAEILIKKYKPKLYICAYHRNEDMFALPLKIHSFVPEYRFYFCHHKYVPAWESNFYGFIPEDCEKQKF